MEEEATDVGDVGEASLSQPPGLQVKIQFHKVHRAFPPGGPIFPSLHPSHLKNPHHWLVLEESNTLC